MQRSLTGSDYGTRNNLLLDHIVMFLRYGKDQTMLFESSNQYGVIEFSYSRFC
jgi:hypothetical protein